MRAYNPPPPPIATKMYENNAARVESKLKPPRDGGTARKESESTLSTAVAPNFPRKSQEY